MADKIHIIIAGENDRPRSWVVRKRWLTGAALVGGLLVLWLGLGSYVAVDSWLHQAQRRQQLTQLQKKAERLRLENSQLQAEISAHELEKQRLLGTAVNQLNERSSQLESILQQVGVEVPVEETSGGSGGPYLEASQVSFEEALSFSAQLIDIAEDVPLGIPSAGYLSSGFGRRRDPFNGKTAFHSGIDIAHFVGTKVYATASGTVVRAGSMPGYGRVVEVANGERFHTLFGHLHKILVKKGDKIARGDVIGTMGNSGRSTGPHLHYEIRDHGRAINPYRLTFLTKKQD